MNRGPRQHLLVLAAGHGTRATPSTPKQFAVDDHGVSVLAHTLLRATHGIAWDSITIAVPGASTALAEQIVESISLGDVAIVTGATHRLGSLRQAAAAVDADEHDVCVVHDGVRPLTPPALFESVVAALASPDVDACWPMSHPRDTTVLADAPPGLRVIPASQVSIVATPIAVRRRILTNALCVDAPDAAVLTDRLLRVGARWTHVDNSWWNLKVTTRDDLEAVIDLLSGRRGVESGRPGSPLD